MENNNKNRVVSGITATGKITIGNYIGAIKSFIELQEKYDLFVFVANLHAITLPISQKDLKENTKAIAALYMACGLDPEKSTIFIQSDVLEHAQLGHIMLCNSTMGELQKMTQFKDKSAKGVKLDNNTTYIPTGLFTYPTLMAADILLYDPHLVPVGKDQKQHIELARNIATRMNGVYGDDLFQIPEEFTPEFGAKIMSLQDPSKKMSKSDSDQNGYIALLDDAATVKRKISKALTDSENKVAYDVENKPGVSNLLVIYSAFSGESIDDIVNKYKDLGYKEFKEGLTKVINDSLEKIQTKYNDIINSPSFDEIMVEGANKARRIAQKKLNKVHNRLGLNYKRK